MRRKIKKIIIALIIIYISLGIIHYKFFSPKIEIEVNVNTGTEIEKDSVNLAPPPNLCHLYNSKISITQIAKSSQRDFRSMDLNVLSKKACTPSLMTAYLLSRDCKLNKDKCKQGNGVCGAYQECKLSSMDIIAEPGLVSLSEQGRIVKCKLTAACYCACGFTRSFLESTPLGK